VPSKMIFAFLNIILFRRRRRRKVMDTNEIDPSQPSANIVTTPTSEEKALIP